ncbi:hypothetical protein L7H23_08780 [Sphingopyxis sp. BSN-002]|uniref:hypothetical protein n=1 Tax=Sphingopyxis sp. BSN-002 TaxID=2911495 RepID=UPI001EDB043F|nr:hypothetical protein [Sphingopyxis sp. BSN-002]UKK86174.1 hypothetical protein L7H23_08780 [Sphingopyxis sp. BSN-002]
MKNVLFLPLISLVLSSCVDRQVPSGNAKEERSTPADEIENIPDIEKKAQSGDRKAISYLITYYRRIGNEDKLGTYVKLGKDNWISSAFYKEIADFNHIISNSKSIKERELYSLAKSCIYLSSIKAEYVYQMSKNGESSFRNEGIDFMQSIFDLNYQEYKGVLDKEKCTIFTKN